MKVVAMTIKIIATSREEGSAPVEEPKPLKLGITQSVY